MPQWRYSGMRALLFIRAALPGPAAAAHGSLFPDRIRERIRAVFAHLVAIRVYLVDQRCLDVSHVHGRARLWREAAHKLLAFGVR